MDARFLINGRQVNHLFADDLPIVAKALVAVIRNRGRVAVDFVNNVSVVHLSGLDFDLFLRGDDWVKLLPYMTDGALNPISLATARAVGVWDAGVIDIVDPDLYRRTLGLLQTLFPQPYPTTNI